MRATDWRVEAVLSRSGDYGAGTGYVGHARFEERRVILRRNHSADYHQNVLAAQLLQLRDDFRPQPRIAACKTRYTQYVDVILRCHPAALPRRLEQRPYIHLSPHTR